MRLKGLTVVDLRRDSAMPESELSPLRSLLCRLTAALIGLSVLCWTGCASSRKATERLRVESSELREARDSLREELTNEARAEPSLLELCLARRRKTIVKSPKI